MNDAADAGRCPLCEGPNGCALAGGRAADASAPCWCVGRSFPEALRVRAAERGGPDRCICADCREADVASEADDLR